MGWLFSFNGRLGRLGYWALNLGAIWVFALAQSVVSISLPDAGGVDLGGLLVLVILGLTTMIVVSSAQVRRAHDRGYSCWALFITLVPVVGLLWPIIDLGLLPGTSGANEHGPQPVL